eukprot:12906931-Prorocentrum_lima.AAC.1
MLLSEPQRAKQALRPRVAASKDVYACRAFFQVRWGKERWPWGAGWGPLPTHATAGGEGGERGARPNPRAYYSRHTSH